jgi:hypothetical protein
MLAFTARILAHQNRCQTLRAAVQPPARLL